MARLADRAMSSGGEAATGFGRGDAPSPDRRAPAGRPADGPANAGRSASDSASDGGRAGPGPASRPKAGTPAAGSTGRRGAQDGGAGPSVIGAPAGSAPANGTADPDVTVQDQASGQDEASVKDRTSGQGETPGQNRPAGKGQNRPAGKGQNRPAGKGKDRPAGQDSAAGKSRATGQGKDRAVGTGTDSAAGKSRAAGRAKTGGSKVAASNRAAGGQAKLAGGPGPAASDAGPPGGAGTTARRKKGGGSDTTGGRKQGAGQKAPVAAVPGDADRERPRMPPVRLAPRDELAAAARVAPLLRAAADLSHWADKHHPVRPGGAGPGDAMSVAAAGAACADLELTPNEVDAAWRVVVATGLMDDGRPDIGQWDDGEVLTAWDSALAAILDAEDLDGLATALYTVGTPVRIDALFEAYTAAAGSPRPERGGPSADEPSAGQRPGDGPVRPRDEDEAGALSRALETLADLGVVELGTEEAAGGLTVTLSPLGIWGVHRRLRGQGWHVPVLGSVDRNGAVGLLMTLASCDTEDGETEIGTWLADHTPVQAARELIQAAAGGSPGLRGAAFAVLERIGSAATAEIRAALDDPLLHAHAAVWLHEHDEEADLRPADRTWLLVDLGAGLLEEADPRDVVAELLPEVPAVKQAEIVAGLWQVDHPGVIDLLTALSEHHPAPIVARAARKAAFKARSPGSAGSGSQD
jgi:hypothetical protein